MSVLLSYPAIQKVVQRLTKKGKVSTHIQRYHTKPFEVRASKPRVKPKYNKEFYEKYISKGKEGFLDLIVDISQLFTSFPEVMGFYRFLIKNKDLKEDKLKSSRATQSLLSLLEKAEHKDRKKRSRARKEISQFLEFGQFLIKNDLLSVKPGKLRDLSRFKYRVADQFRDILESPHLKDYIELTKALQEKNPEIFNLENTSVSHRKLLSEALRKFASSSKFGNLLRENQELIENFNLVLELLGHNPLERKDIEKLLKESVYRNHFFNKILKSIAKENLSKNFYETLLNLEYSNDAYFFSSLLKSVVTGEDKYGMSLQEAISLFFYVNGAGTKDFPLNYKHLNTTLRKITAETLEKGEFKLDRPEEEFYYSYFLALDSALDKLPDAKEEILYRGEGLTSASINAKKGDLIIFDTPTSTTPYENKKTTVTQKYYEEETGEIVEIKTPKVVGAKRFMFNFGKSVVQAKAILEGKKPELYEGQREDLRKMIGKVGTIPSGVLFKIQNTELGFAKKIPYEFVGGKHKGYDEVLIRPGASYKVTNSYIEGESENPALVIHLEPQTYVESGSLFFRRVLPAVSKHTKMIKPKKKER